MTSAPNFSAFPWDQLPRLSRAQARAESVVARWLAVVLASSSSSPSSPSSSSSSSPSSSSPSGLAQLEALVGAGPIRARVVSPSPHFDPHAATCIVKHGDLSIEVRGSSLALRAVAQRVLGGAEELPAPRPLSLAEESVWALVVASALEDLGLPGTVRLGPPRPTRGYSSSPRAAGQAAVPASAAKRSNNASPRAVGISDSASPRALVGGGSNKPPVSGTAPTIAVGIADSASPRAVVGGEASTQPVSGTAPTIAVGIADSASPSARTIAGSVSNNASASMATVVGRAPRISADAPSSEGGRVGRGAGPVVVELQVDCAAQIQFAIQLHLPAGLELRSAQRPVDNGSFAKTVLPTWAERVSIDMPIVIGRCAIARDDLSRIRLRSLITLDPAGPPPAPTSSAHAPQAPSRYAASRQGPIRGADLEILGGTVALRATLGAVVGEVATGYLRRDMTLPDDAHVELTVALGTTQMSLRQVFELAVGQVVQLGRPLAGPFEVRAAGKTIGRGELVDVDGELAVRIVSLGDKE